LENVECRESKGETPISTVEELKERLNNLREHESIKVSEDLRKFLIENFEFKEPGYDNISEVKNLGLYLKYEGNTLTLCTYYFIGVWWFREKDIYIRVEPKDNEGKFADPILMLNEIMKDQDIVSNKEFQNVFRIEDNASPISLESGDTTFMLFLIVKYINVLERLVRKGLKRGYVFAEEDLNGRVKGKINLKRTYQKHISRGVYTKNYCKFQVFTEDFLDNQILKSALFQASKYVRNLEFQSFTLMNLLSYLSSVFEKVSLRPISDIDFVKVKHSPFFPEYKEAIELARMILKYLGYDPFANIQELKEVPPYIVNMPKLFELYVWKKLKELCPNSEILYQYRAGSDTPDFLIKDRDIIIDAKYKYRYDSKSLSEDIGQLARYGRNEKIRKEINAKEEPILIIAYPVFDENRKGIEPINDYCRFYKLAIAIPYREYQVK